MPIITKKRQKLRVTIDPRQTPFLNYLFDKKSDTYLDVYKSAIKAQYSKTYGENLKGQMPKWLLENIGKERMLKKAEKNIDEMLDYNGTDTKIRIKADITKFTLERRAREVWGKDEQKSGNTYNFIVIKPEARQAIARRIIEENTHSSEPLQKDGSGV